MKTITQRFVTGKNTYAIVHNEEEGWYGAINYNYIDDEGKLNRQLNGLQMHIADTPAKVIENVKFAERFEELMNSGMTVEAVCRMMAEEANA